MNIQYDNRIPDSMNTANIVLALLSNSDPIVFHAVD